MVDKEKIKQLALLFFDMYGKMTIADDGKVSVAGDVKMKINLSHLPAKLKNNLSHLPVQFDTVDGIFLYGGVGLQSLQGSPTKVERAFVCANNQLISLEGGPDWVGGDFWCESNPLESLKGFPSAVGGWFFCNYDPNLPLLRTLVAKKGVIFQNKRKYPFAEKIKNVLNQFAGQGKAGVLKCSHALLSLEKELQETDPTISLRDNIRW